ncbi:ABC transporter C family member 10 [Melia azedarach]|uniref:ABC transporter C family member 10 n=1 Tax=Melia azedarach TaxID=155640 RepID=A0ACC1XKW8_MELAZ|nr:ABC transporter C family member 10 [Melia azedarach]
MDALEAFLRIFCGTSGSKEIGSICNSVHVSFNNLHVCLNNASIIFVDFLVLVMLLIFFILRSFSNKIEISPRLQGFSPLQITSVIYNGGLGLVYLGFGLSIIVKKLDEEKTILPLHEWLEVFFQGFTWLLLSFTFSLKLRQFQQAIIMKLCSILAFSLALFVCISSIWAAILHQTISVKMVLNFLCLPGAILLISYAFQEPKSAESDPDEQNDSLYASLQPEEFDVNGEYADESVSPLADAGLLRKMTFWWLKPLIEKGKKRVLENTDVPQLCSADRAKTRYSLFMEEFNQWSQKRLSEHYSILRTIISRHEVHFSFWVLCIDQGDIVNYVTVDASGIGEFPYWFHQIWSTSLQLCIALVVVYYSVGLATIATIIVIILTVVGNSPFAKLQHKYQEKFMMAQNQRLKAITEALVNIKVCKLYAWESYFKNVIEKLRSEEYGRLNALQLQKGYYLVLFWSSPIEPLRLLPDVFGAFIEAKVSLDRIANFIQAPELRNSDIPQISNGIELKYSILIKSADLSWEADLLKPTLRNINVEVKRGGKIAICGEVGAGKSTVLAAILGELPSVQGTEYAIRALSGKTVLLVTHQLDFLPAFDSVLVRENSLILWESFAL